MRPPASAAEQLPQHVLEDSAVLVVLPLFRGVDPNDALETRDLTISCSCAHVYGFCAGLQTGEIKRFGTVQAQAVGAFAGLEDQFRYSDETYDRVIRDYNLKDLGI